MYIVGKVYYIHHTDNSHKASVNLHLFLQCRSFQLFLTQTPENNRTIPLNINQNLLSYCLSQMLRLLSMLAEIKCMTREYMK